MYHTAQSEADTHLLTPPDVAQAELVSAVSHCRHYGMREQLAVTECASKRTIACGARIAVAAELATVAFAAAMPRSF